MTTGVLTSVVDSRTLTRIRKRMSEAVKRELPMDSELLAMFDDVRNACSDQCWTRFSELLNEKLGQFLMPPELAQVSGCSTAVNPRYVGQSQPKEQVDAPAWDHGGWKSLAFDASMRSPSRRPHGFGVYRCESLAYYGSWTSGRCDGGGVLATCDGMFTCCVFDKGEVVRTWTAGPEGAAPEWTASAERMAQIAADTEFLGLEQEVPWMCRIRGVKLSLVATGPCTSPLSDAAREAHSQTAGALARPTDPCLFRCASIVVGDLEGCPRHRELVSSLSLRTSRCACDECAASRV